MALEFKWPIIIAFNELGPEIAFFCKTYTEEPIFLYLGGVEHLQR